jgi:hypothetical protein
MGYHVLSSYGHIQTSWYLGAQREYEDQPRTILKHCECRLVHRDCSSSCDTHSLFSARPFMLMFSVSFTPNVVVCPGRAEIMLSYSYGKPR